MPTPTYDLISSTTLAAAAPSVVFGSIPQGYRDLVVVLAVSQNTTSPRQVWMRPNGDTSNSTLVFMDGTGSGAGTSGTAAANTAFYVASGVPANTITTSISSIMDYSATDKHKTFLTRAGTSGEPVSAYASRWASTVAITSIVFEIIEGPSYNAGSTFSLYGIVA
jgi:hypothetical protein